MMRDRAGARLLRRGTRRVSEDRGLINYLMRHRHTTPFEMRDQVPRQTADLRRATVDPPPHRQRQRILARYSILDNAEFTSRRPSTWRRRRRQPPGPRRVAEGGGTARPRLCCARILSAPTPATRRCRTRARRVPLDPAWPGSLANWRDEFVAELLHAMVLEDRSAQSDAFPSAYAPTRTRNTRSAPMPRQCSPRCSGAAGPRRLVEYRMNAASISATGRLAIQRMLAGETVEQKDSRISPRMARTNDRTGPLNNPLPHCGTEVSQVRWRGEAAELALDQPGKSDRRSVFQVIADDLRADR